MTEARGAARIASENLAGGSNLAGDNAEIARTVGNSPLVLGRFPVDRR